MRTPPSCLHSAVLPPRLRVPGCHRPSPREDAASCHLYPYGRRSPDCSFKGQGLELLYMLQQRDDCFRLDIQKYIEWGLIDMSKDNLQIKDSFFNEQREGENPYLNLIKKGRAKIAQVLHASRVLALLVLR